MNKEVIIKRIRNLRSKTLNVYVPKTLTIDVKFNRSLDYCLRMLNYTKLGFYKINLDNKEVMIPVSIYNHVVEKVNTTKKILYNIDKMLLVRE